MASGSDGDSSSGINHHSRWMNHHSRLMTTRVDIGGRTNARMMTTNDSTNALDASPEDVVSARIDRCGQKNLS